MEERATAMRLLGVEPRFMHHRFIPKDEFSRLLDAGAQRGLEPVRPVGFRALRALAYDHNTPPPLA